MLKPQPSLAEAFLKLKQALLLLSYNPLLISFEFEHDCLELLDHEALNDTFVADKKTIILQLIKNHGVDWNSVLKSAFDEYNEGLTCQVYFFTIYSNQ